MRIENKDRKFLKYLFALQLVIEIADDGINEGLLIHEDKRDTKKYLKALVERNARHFKACYDRDAEIYVPLSTIMEGISNGISSMSLDELLTFQQNLHEYIEDSRKKTDAEFDKIRARNATNGVGEEA